MSASTSAPSSHCGYDPAITASVMTTAASDHRGHLHPRPATVRRRTLTTPSLLRIHGTQSDLLSRLPVELGLHIMDLLANTPPAYRFGSAALGNSSSPSACTSTRTLCACAVVCRYWARLALDDSIWQRHFSRVVAARLFHVDPGVLHPMCDFAGLPRPNGMVPSVAGSSSAGSGSGEWADNDDDDDEEEDGAYYLTDRDLIGLLSARVHLGVLDAASLHSLRWCMSLPPAALRDPALAHRRTLILDHLMRTTYPAWLAPYPPLNFRWLSKWKYACAVARADTRRVVLTSAELVRLCFYMHFNDWDNATLTRGGGVFPGRLPPTNVSVFCADGQYRTTYYPPDSPIRMYWHWITDRMDGSVVAAAPFVRDMSHWDDDEVSEDDEDEDESSSNDEDDSDDDDEHVSEDGRTNSTTASGWSLRPLMPVGPMTPVAAPSSGPGAGHVSHSMVMPAAMAHAQYPVSPAPAPTSAAMADGRASTTSWVGYSRASLARIPPAHARFLSESRFIGRPELPLASTRHHRYRESLLQVDNYLPLTISRNPSTGQWVMLNRYYIFESLQQPVGPGIAWVAIADQHQPYQQHQHIWPPGGDHHHQYGHHPAHPVYPHYP
ncbi:hypothetical protein BCR44DRAFT_1509484 [Catenaria anguillulae PL171]|uniref:F-box domain-containing protein n=1 Tax=Catenaria anguillulae PL171 TaxID=765915 RepID=A0A1Y2I004_9FUNG|nr:hypothetical protein BCR44DRAFT_1509484 [Catenaria anguillulae PL171]